MTEPQFDNDLFEATIVGELGVILGAFFDSQVNSQSRAIRYPVKFEGGTTKIVQLTVRVVDN